MRAWLFAAITLAVACNKSTKSEGYSCWMGNVCEDYPTNVDAHKKDCKALAGEWEERTCPSDNLVGTCITDTKQSRMYYGGSNAYTSDTASASCEHELHGSWTAATK